MQGGNGRTIELTEGCLQALDIGQALTRIGVPASSQPDTVHRHVRSRHRTLVLDKARGFGQGLQQALTQALRKLGRGGIGERGHDNLARRALLLQQQPQIERADGPGLAGTGAGLDQTASAVVEREFGPILWRVHDASPVAASPVPSVSSATPSWSKASSASASRNNACKAWEPGSDSLSPNRRSPSSRRE